MEQLYLEQNNGCNNPLLSELLPSLAIGQSGINYSQIAIQSPKEREEHFIKGLGGKLLPIPGDALAVGQF